MWAWLALAAFAVAATTNAAGAAPISGAAPIPAAEQAGLPTFTPPSSLRRGDLLDEWCKGPTTAINIAVCGDEQLRGLAIERLRAFDEARRRLGPDQQKALAADQNGWAMSYPQGCGLPSNTMPASPLAASVKECLAKAGRERLAYLRAYGTAGAGATSAGATGPTSQPAPQPSQLTAAAIAPFERGAQSQTLATSPSNAPVAQPPQASAQSPTVPQNTGTSPQSTTASQPSAASGSPPAQTPKPVQTAQPAPTAAPAAAQTPPPASAATPPAALHETPALKSATSQPAPGNGMPEWGTWRGNAVLAAIAIGVFCIGLWVGAAARGRRRGRGPEPGAATPVSRDARL